MSDLSGEIQGLKEEIKRLQGRLSTVERRVGLPPSPAPAPVARPSPAPAAAVAVNRPPASRTLETRIGRDWLNRIGITSLVLGVAFFILYTFQYLGPVAKLAVGYAVGGALLGLGIVLERRHGLEWYGRGIIGGGWALVYFTTYAMHHIPAVRVLRSPLVDFCLLLAVAVGAVGHSLKYRSETITATALLLGFLTIAIGDVTYFTLAAAALLVASLVWLVIRQRWYGLYVYGIVASYVIYAVWVSPQIHLSRIIAIHTANVTEAEFWLKTGFLLLYWLGYNLALVVRPALPRVAQQRLLTGTLVNALAFVSATLSNLGPVYPAFRYPVLLGIAAAYVVSVPLARRQQLPSLADAHLLLGLTLATVALPLKWSTRWTSSFWLLELITFVWIGLRHARWPYRVFGFGVAMLMAFKLLIIAELEDVTPITLGPWQVPWRLLIGLLGVLAFGVAAAGYRLPRFRAVQHAAEAQTFHTYFTIAGILLATVIALEAPTGWYPALWALEGAATVWLGFRLQDRGLRLLGGLGLGGTALAEGILILAEPLRRSVAAVVIASLLVMGGRARRAPRGATFTHEGIFRYLYDLAGTVLLTAALWVEVSHYWRSIAWALEGIALVGAGFALRDKVFRLAGLGVFGILILKILFVDLAAAATIYRILSFIVAGCILLAASYAYARFSGKADASSQ